MKKPLTIFFFFVFSSLIYAQNADYSKMSGFIRDIALNNPSSSLSKSSGTSQKERFVTALVKIKDEAGLKVLENQGCKFLGRVSNICIASIPLSGIEPLSLQKSITRIEANKPCHLLMDTAATIIDALSAYSGKNMTQAYTGKGVLIGVEDVGFDLTHPNFYDALGIKYRLKRFWDQLTPDSLGGKRKYVGAEYTTQDEMLAYRCSFDSKIEFHGTHTSGSAVGSGYTTPYRGIAYESDIALVNNTVTDDTIFVDKNDIYKYTSAVDALGFKYLFDCADSLNMPCVISFSEGMNEDFDGSSLLFEEMLDSLVGKGRIIVASAGNYGHYMTYLHKAGTESRAASFVIASKNEYNLRMKADGPFTISLVDYDDKTKTPADSIAITSEQIKNSADSIYVDSLVSKLNPVSYKIKLSLFKSVYDAADTAVNISIKGSVKSGSGETMAIILGGDGTDIKVFGDSDTPFFKSADNSAYNDAAFGYSIVSPSSGKRIISVGSTAYRDGCFNYLNEYNKSYWGKSGERAYFSSIGPTLDGRTKPDVLAPGANIVSSYNSSFLLEHPSYDVQVVSKASFRDSTYCWGAMSGTSMSTPIVAGTIALWLQAKPDLTPEEIMDVIANTSRHHDVAASYPNNYYGYGEIDAYKGLLYILGLLNVKDISDAHPKNVSISPTADGTIKIMWAHQPEHPFTVNVYTVSGMCIYSRTISDISDTEYSLDADKLQPGVYAVQINGSDADAVGSSLIRF